MKKAFTNFCRFVAVMTAIGGVDAAMAETAPNPRSAVAGRVAPGRADGRAVVRDGTSADVNAGRAMTNRSATTNVSARSVVAPTRAGNVAPQKSVSRSATVARSGAVARSAAVATGAKRSARSATNVNHAAGLARAASIARATAVFNDVSKIGGGYSKCRDAYATCMDQFCANANDTYRRCYCSARFTEFRDTEYALDEAKTLLMKFQDNNLNAVDKTADEVAAMYSATAGEAAIRNDTSGAQSILNEIGDLLSGKKKKSSSPATNTPSIGVLDLDFSMGSSSADPFGDGAGTFGASIFDTSTSVDLTSLEGMDLYNASHKQCMQAVADSCESKAVLNMATSAYGIMISQDCNAYEKSVDTKREAVKQTVREAEKILRDARLEEYRAHNSQDVNECIDRVRSAMLAESACGSNYKRCLDYTGAYINPTTGEAIYSPRLFELENIITLDSATSDTNTNGYTDLLEQNDNFNAFLESKKMFANSALDTCRSLADTVWTEFKRAALIEIAQAQDEKIESVKESCVETMSECYDTQSNALREFDTSTAQVSGALSAAAARAMCADKVSACAALYSHGGATCNFDGNGHFVSKNDATQDSCGLTQLLNYVNAVDTVRVAEGCATAIESYARDLCTPTSGDGVYPWNCRNLTPTELERNIMSRVFLYCVKPDGDKLVDEGATKIDQIISDPTIREDVRRVYDEIVDAVTEMLVDACEENNGVWYDDPKEAFDVYSGEDFERESSYYNNTFGRTATGGDRVKTEAYGACIANSTRNACLAHNDMGNGVKFAEYNAERDMCNFTNGWYEHMCTVMLGGIFQDGMCYWDAMGKLYE